MKNQYEVKGNPEAPINSHDVYTRINFKAKSGINELNSEERERLEDMLIENFSERVTKLSDEDLLQMFCDDGMVI